MASDALRAALVAAHTVHTYVEYRPWWDTVWRPLETLPTVVVAAGSATATRSSLVRRTGSLSLSGQGCLPTADLTGPVSPRNRYRLWRGVSYPDGTNEDILLGTFMPTRWAPTIDSSGPTVSLDLADEMKRVALDPLPAPLNVSALCRVDDLLRWLLTDLAGWSAAVSNGLVSYVDRDASGGLTGALVPTFTDPRTGSPQKPSPAWETTGPLAVEDPDVLLGTDSTFEGDRLAAVEAVANAANVAVYLNTEGNPVVTRRVVDVDTSVWTDATLAPYVAWSFDGGDGGSLLSIAHEWSLDAMTNEVVLASGDWGKRYTVTSGPLAVSSLGMSLRYVEDASSQPFGDSPTLLNKYGRRVSREHLGAARKRSLASLVVPFLAPDDFVLAADYDTAGQTGSTLLVVDDITIPLDAAAGMDLATSSLDLEDFVE